MLEDSEDPRPRRRAQVSALVAELATALRAGGIVCFPVAGTYRLVVDAHAEAAVMRLMQSKRRTSNHPALLLVPDLAGAGAVVDGTAWPTTQRLAERLWPGPLTLVLAPSEALPPAVRRLLTRATGKLGVRAPDDELARKVLAAFGGPLLLSSANFERKTGASSAAAVRQRFVGKVDVWVDAGDPRPAKPSTLVAPTESSWQVLREGAVTRAEIEQALA
ncbi:MAG: L-threonylcarbamoyladenylate synthase [Kofleriaceae bacterium]